MSGPVYGCQVATRIDDHGWHSHSHGYIVMTMSDPVRPLRRAERRLVTRERLLDAAAELFAERGFHAAKLDDVAARAGYTIGAIYHNFNSKEDLFVATFELMISRYIDAFRRVLDEGADLAARRQLAAGLLTRMLAQQPQWFVLYLEFCTYALRNPAQMPFFAERFGAFRDASADWLDREANTSGVSLPMAATDLALLLNALTNGFGLAKLLHGSAVRDDLYEAGLELILAPLAQEPARTKGA
jgi:AcrR family transcriptional regulator